MTSQAYSEKTEGKEHLTNAIGGLIFLIGGYIIFLQINPAILNIDFSTASWRVTIVAGEIDINIDNIGEPDDSDNCEEFNSAYVKKGLDTQKCSNGEELDGIFSWLETIGASIPSDTVQSIRDSWSDGKITPKAQCEQTRTTMMDFVDTRVSPGCYACNKGVGITQKFCFNYNAAEVREKDIARWKKNWKDKGYHLFCGRKNNVNSEENLIHSFMGGHKVPFNNGNGLQLKYFSESGEESSSYSLKYPELCVAGKPLDDQWEVVGESCDMGTKTFTTDCVDLFKKMVEDDKKYKKCGASDWKPVYDRNEELFNIAIKKSCISR